MTSNVNDNIKAYGYYDGLLTRSIPAVIFEFASKDYANSMQVIFKGIFNCGDCQDLVDPTRSAEEKKVRTYRLHRVDSRPREATGTCFGYSQQLGASQGPEIKTPQELFDHLVRFQPHLKAIPLKQITLEDLLPWNEDSRYWH